MSGMMRASTNTSYFPMTLTRWFICVAVICALIVFWTISVPGLAQAGSTSVGVVVKHGKPWLSTEALLTTVSARCSRLVRLQGRDVLVNTCGQCRNVQIARSRGGGALPELRTFRLEGGGRLDLPFKGPGSTRISTDESCALDTAEDRRDGRAVQEANAQCIFIARVARGYVVFNRCPACRSTVVRWSYPDGVENNYSVAIEPRKTLAIPKGTEVGISVAHEESCAG